MVWPAKSLTGDNDHLKKLLILWTNPDQIRVPRIRFGAAFHSCQLSI